MQEQEMENKPRPFNLLTIGKLGILFWRARRHSEALEQFIQLYQSIGVSEQKTAFMKEQYVAMMAALDDEVWFKMERYLVGGIGVIDLILLQIILPMSLSDISLQIALFTLVVSLPLTAGDLFFKFLTEKVQVTSYRIHLLTGLSVPAGAGALTALIWHDSPLSGIVFLCLAMTLYFLVYLYTGKLVNKKHSAYGMMKFLKMALSMLH